jgi:hypothetical protein
MEWAEPFSWDHFTFKKHGDRISCGTGSYQIISKITSRSHDFATLASFIVIIPPQPSALNFLGANYIFWISFLVTVVAGFAVRLFEQGKRDGLPNKIIREEGVVEEALQGIIQERRLRQILPTALKRHYNITSDYRQIIAELNNTEDFTEKLPYGVKLILGDCTTEQIAEQIPAPLSLIFTDPPYNMESVELFSN